MHDYAALVEAQRNYFATKATLSYAFRIAQLQKLAALVLQYEEEILHAIYLDLHKSRFEAWAVETGVITHEIRYFVKHLKKWMRAKRARTPMLHFRSASYIQRIPYGNTLIIAPWNYPFLLAIRPLIGAIAGGNTAIVKPSEQSAHTAAVMEKMINTHFESGYLHVVNTDAQGTGELLKQTFDHIFFTGGSSVGKIVYTAAAANLTPVVLEMGGKNPCIIEPDADLDVTAARLAWGKFSNAGQTCVAPDYLIIHEDIRDALIDKLKKRLDMHFGTSSENSPHYGRIINPMHVQRLQKLLSGAHVVYGGRVIAEDKFIEPTLVEIQDRHAPIMQEEIFGPILPYLTYRNRAEVEEIIAKNPNPLVLYLFTRNKASVQQYANEISCGDMVVNELVLHFGHLHLPIGGKGSSGMGKYQGKYSFEAFTHPKSVMHRKFFPDLAIRYPPYTTASLSRLQQFYRHFFH